MQAAETIDLPQPKLSRLLNGQFRGVSVSKMLEAINRLGRDVKLLLGRINLWLSLEDRDELRSFDVESKQNISLRLQRQNQR
jgi:hypothetical protein